MKLKINKELDTKQDLLVLGIFNEDKEKFKKTNPALRDELESAVKDKRFKFEFGKTIHTNIHNSMYKGVLVVCLGEKNKLDAEKIRRAGAKAVKASKSLKFKGFTTDIAQKISKSTKIKPEIIGKSIAEGIVLSNYVFDKYKENKDKVELTTAVLQFSNSADFLKGIRIGEIIANSTNFSKELVNEPPIVTTPSYLERTAKNIASKSSKMTIKVLNKKDMKKLGMNALLSVSKGSVEQPKLIILTYNGGNSKTTALVGKGITYDSGGYNIKPTGYLEDMKCDMGGAAAVLGTMKAISELKLKKKVIGVIPTCENLVSSTAYKPGDIIKAYNGKTIEIGNTDAEGRLVLADALSYTEEKYKPDQIIDIATLTGACMIALGYYASGLVGNDDKLQSELEKAGNESYDRVWRLPFFEEYQDNMDGDVSDLNNVSLKQKSYGGAITAGVFLSKFVKKAKWAHLDIAATGYLKEEIEYLQKYGSGAGVRIFTYFLMN